MYYCYKQDWKQHEQWKTAKKIILCSNNEHAIYKQYLDQILLYQLNIFNWKSIWFLLTTSLNKPKIFLVFKLGCLFFFLRFEKAASLSLWFLVNDWCNKMVHLMTKTLSKYRLETSQSKSGYYVYCFERVWQKSWCWLLLMRS